MTENQSEEQENQPWLDRLVSDGVLGTLVLLMTITTAVAAYNGAIAEIRGDAIEDETQSDLALGTTSFIQASIEYLADSSIYFEYESLRQTDPEGASLVLEHGSEALQSGVLRPDGPFDEIYKEALYGDALSLIENAGELRRESDAIDAQARQYQRASLALAIGLATAAWASLVEARALIRLVFTLISLPFFIAGSSIVLSALFGS